MSLIKIETNQEVVKAKYKSVMDKLAKGEKFEDFSVEELLYSILGIIVVADEPKVAFLLKIIKDFADYDYDDIKYRPIVEIIEGLQFLEKEKIIEILDALIQFEIMSEMAIKQLKGGE